jgi:hypothetical protein
MTKSLQEKIKLIEAVKDGDPLTSELIEMIIKDYKAELKFNSQTGKEHLYKVIMKKETFEKLCKLT